MSNFLTHSPWMQFFWQRWPLLLAILLYLSFAGVGAMLLAGRILARRRKRSSYDKCARQLGCIGLCIGFPLLIASKVYFYLQTGQWFSITTQGFFTEIAWVMVALILLYLLLYVAIWKLTQKATWIQNIFGSICLLQGLVSTFVLLIIAKLTLTPHIDLTWQTFPQFLLDSLPPLGSATLLALVITLPILFALPAIFGNIGLLCVRKLHDYGRDHYNIAISWCTAWLSRCGLWIILICLMQAGYIYYQQWQAHVFLPWEFLDLGIFTGIWVVVVFIMTFIARSTIPLRHKLSMCFADILVIFSCYIYLRWLLTTPSLPA
ncbi:MAG: hypothetical protein IJU79_06175 [Desulfovibrionaceae bacterium]|nr:hypothetical protein [Desulfovibrionaceae bacterium]